MITTDISHKKAQKAHVRIYYIIIMFLLMNSFGNYVFGCCSMICSPCEHADQSCSYCVPCSGTCCSGGCFPSGSSCCGSSYCESGKHCSSGHCCPSDEEWCSSASDCYNPSTQECCGSGICNKANCESCSGGQCKVCGGDSKKCCNSGACYDKCTSMGEKCRHSPPGILSTCPMANIDDPSCGAWTTGLVCSWEESVVHTNSATCTPQCGSPCGLYADGEPCSRYKPITCDDQWVIFYGNVCTCYKIPDLWDWENSGSHYQCP